jgi:hypothetical protein
MFEIVNPVIVGTFKTKYNTDSSMDAAKHFWNNFTKLTANETPVSFFSIKDNDNKLYHFKVTEEKSSNNTADYMISQLNNINKKNSNIIMKIFNDIMSNTHSGGNLHRDDSSSSSSSSSSDELVNRFNKLRMMQHNQIIGYYHYIPSIYGNTSVFIPSFIYPIQAPYIELGFSTAFWA